MARDYKTVKITRLRLKQATILGLGGDVLLHLSDTEQIGHKPFKMVFDEDPRFIRIESAGNDKEKVCIDLIPLTNVDSMKVSA